ncbi:hypothetical protein HGA91_05620 [candidate division WWE3 bacterium]|nr:hypothetical protein [candidate division WWE3 bacterium]
MSGSDLENASLIYALQELQRRIKRKCVEGFPPRITILIEDPVSPETLTINGRVVIEWDVSEQPGAVKTSTTFIQFGVGFVEFVTSFHGGYVRNQPQRFDMESSDRIIGIVLALCAGLPIVTVYVHTLGTNDSEIGFPLI